MLSEATKALKRFELKLQNHESDLYDLTVFSLRPCYRRVITIISITKSSFHKCCIATGYASRYLFKTFKTIRLSAQDFCHVIVDCWLSVDTGKARINFHDYKSKVKNLTV